MGQPTLSEFYSDVTPKSSFSEMLQPVTRNSPPTGQSVDYLSNMSVAIFCSGNQRFYFLAPPLIVFGFRNVLLVRSSLLSVFSLSLSLSLSRCRSLWSLSLSLSRCARAFACDTFCSPLFRANATILKRISACLNARVTVSAHWQKSLGSVGL